MQTAQNMSGSTTVSTPPPGAGSAATNTTTPANASAASAPPAFVPDAAQMRKAQVALMRFGLGPKRGQFSDFVSSSDPDIARKLCLAELNDYAEYIRKKARYDQQARTGNVFTGSKLSNARLAEFGAGIVPVDPVSRQELTYQFCGHSSISTDKGSVVLTGELLHRYDMGLRPKLGFVERLVMFWSNHFSMYRDKAAGLMAQLGHYERTVIRRHVLGNFSDMLVETIKHSAMLMYLDNANSGGFSRETIQGSDGSPLERVKLANQNLAREILELHTMGTGNQFGQRIAFTQDDVLALSMMLTGWNVDFRGHNRGKEPNWAANFPTFAQSVFNESMHHEGSYTLMGRTFSARGQQKTIDALLWLASLNSTSIHLCTKLLRHFVTSDPTRAMVLRLNHVFQTSGGNLLAVSKALLNMQEAWDTPLERIRPPALWMVSMTRALGMSAEEFVDLESVDKWQWERRLLPLRNATWSCITPDGFPEKESAWVDPNAMRVRTSLAAQILLDARSHREARPELSPIATADELYGTTLPWVARPWLDRGDRYSNNQTISAMFLSPDFMTR